MRFVLLFVVLLTCCATYSEKISASYKDISKGEMSAALGEINNALNVKDSKQLPSQTDENTNLLLLERATILQGLGEYELSARDFVLADQNLGWFDPRKMSSIELADYTYSANSTEYRAPASERLLINVQNMINFLVLNELSAAKVEARRFSILTEYFRKQDEAFLPDILALGNYLAGVTFEKSAEFRDAARMYGRAWHFGYREKELNNRLVDLYRITGSITDNTNPNPSGLDTIQTLAKRLPPLSIQEYLAKYKDDVLVIVQTGRVAEKREKKVSLEKQDEKKLGRELGQDFNSINIPTMAKGYSGAQVILHLGHRSTNLSYKSRLGLELERAFTAIQPAIYSAAMSRALSRHLVGESADRVGGKNKISSLIGLSLKGALNSKDRPDTRSWSTSPATISFVRQTYADDTYRFATLSTSQGYESKVISGDFPVVNFSKFR